MSSFLLASLFSVCCFFYSFYFVWPRELCGFFAGSLRENRLGSSFFILLQVLFGLNRWLDDVISFKLTTFIPLLLPLLFLAARHSGYNVEWGHLALTPLSTHNLCSRLRFHCFCVCFNFECNFIIYQFDLLAHHLHHSHHNETGANAVRVNAICVCASVCAVCVYNIVNPFDPKRHFIRHVWPAPLMQRVQRSTIYHTRI